MSSLQNPIAGFGSGLPDIHSADERNKTPAPSSAIAASFDPQFPPREARTVTALLLGRISRSDGLDGLCLIRNVSSHGLKAEAVLPLKPGEFVEIDLRTRGSIAGTVRWTHEGRAGIACHDSLDDRGAPPVSSRDKTLRFPRLLTDCSAGIRYDGRHYGGTVENLSLGGARVATRAPLVRDRLVKFTVTGLPGLDASVRWVEGPLAGLAFLNAPSYAEFANWLNHRALRFSRKGLTESL